jgi:fermentation-respiration switch protein FrsA (DUF1100 family)
MGAAVAIMCSAWNTEVEALVADSAFATHRSAIDYHVRRVLHLPSVPFLWLADAQRLYAAAQEPKELWLLPDADHCGAYFADRPAYVAKIETFFHRSLARAPQRSAS